MSSALEVSEKLKKQFDVRRNNPSDIWGVNWPFKKLNMITGGIQKGELAVLIADSSVGKSSLAGLMAQTAAEWILQKGLQDKREVRVITLEMVKEAFLSRCACADSGVPKSRVRNGYVNASQADAYIESLSKLGTMPIRYFDAAEIPSVESLNQALASEIDGKRCLFWILDHFHICPKPGGAGGDAPGHEALANQLTLLSRKVAPGLVLAQMTKEALKRDNKRPQMMDVRYSSLLCNNADIVLGLYREDKYVKWPEDRKYAPRPAELEIIKSRDGETGTLYLDFMPDRLLWVEKEKVKDE